MESNQEQLEKDEIVNPEQFQVGRAPQEDKEEQTDDAEYTEQEIPFADGKGTELDEELGEDAELDTDLEDEEDGDTLEEDGAIDTDEEADLDLGDDDFEDDEEADPDLEDDELEDNERQV